MVITRLSGGLGNQLFQYAFGRYLSHRYKTNLYIDSTFLKRTNVRLYALEPFNIVNKPLSSIKKIKIWPEWWLGDLLYQYDRTRKSQWYLKFEQKEKQLFRRVLHPEAQFPQDQFRFGNLVSERYFHFDAQLKDNATDNVMIMGFWLSEQYFKDIRPVLRKELAVKAKPSGLNLNLLNEINSTSSVAIHIRRGDFLLPHYSKTFINLPLSYYRSAIDRVVEEVNDPHFFIFSDDPGWVKENFILEYPATYISHNHEKASHEDLRLMAACKHQVTANSTFSWWGAWLNDHPGKIVCTPERWYNLPGHDQSDLLPESWIKIPYELEKVVR
jgi:hypothetical protein